MATPLKPWEKNGGGLSPPGLSSSTPMRGSATTGTDNSKSPGQPAVPPRPTSVTTAAANGGYGRYYSPSYPAAGPSYGYGMYGSGYGSGYGGYGSSYGYRPYGMYGGSGYGGQEDSTVFRQAEERTRMAFQSVESVVGAVASVSMMLESTYVAVHSCFRALIGVAEHFSRLRNHIWSILSAISIIRRIKCLLRQLLHILRLRTYTQADETWDSVSVASSLATQQAQQSSQKLWPAVMFFTVIVGVPWLLWKLVMSVSTDPTNPSTWSSNETNGVNSDSSSVARALYPFNAEASSELTINAGDELVIAPRQLQPNIPGWILVGRNKKSGLVPANYVEILPGSSGNAMTVGTGNNSTKTTPSPALTLSDD